MVTAAGQLKNCSGGYKQNKHTKDSESERIIQYNPQATKEHVGKGISGKVNK
jgi:hypothetical protein